MNDIEKERENYKELEETARKEVLERLEKVANDLNDLGFDTTISSEGGNDGSDLLLTVKKREYPM